MWRSPCSSGVLFERVSSHSLLLLFLSCHYPAPRHTIYLFLVLCPLPHSLGDSCPFFIFFCRVSSQMKKVKVLKNLKMSCLKQKVKPWHHDCCCLSPMLWKLQELGCWTVSQPSIISWKRVMWAVSLVVFFLRVVLAKRLSLWPQPQTSPEFRP